MTASDWTTFDQTPHLLTHMFQRNDLNANTPDISQGHYMTVGLGLSMRFQLIDGLFSSPYTIIKKIYAIFLSSREELLRLPLSVSRSVCMSVQKISKSRFGDYIAVT